jgi:hypothetical protein
MSNGTIPVGFNVLAFLRAIIEDEPQKGHRNDLADAS